MHIYYCDEENRNGADLSILANANRCRCLVPTCSDRCLWWKPPGRWGSHQPSSPLAPQPSPSPTTFSEDVGNTGLAVSIATWRVAARLVSDSQTLRAFGKCEEQEQWPPSGRKELVAQFQNRCQKPIHGNHRQITLLQVCWCPLLRVEFIYLYNI